VGNRLWLVTNRRCLTWLLTKTQRQTTQHALSTQLCLDTPDMSSIEIVETWLKSTGDARCPLTPPPEHVVVPHPHKLKRKRAMSLPTNAAGPPLLRGESPKRRRVDDAEDIEPAHSASQLGSDSLLPLKDSNTFPPPASRASSSLSRARSPTRESPIILKSASPPVLTESLNGLQEPPPQHVDQLGEYLAAGVDLHFIPRGLKVRCTWSSLLLPEPC
jgi:hypothetical protein